MIKCNIIEGHCQIDRHPCEVRMTKGNIEAEGCTTRKFIIKVYILSVKIFSNKKHLYHIHFPKPVVRSFLMKFPLCHPKYLRMKN